MRTDATGRRAGGASRNLYNSPLAGVWAVARYPKHPPAFARRLRCEFVTGIGPLSKVAKRCAALLTRQAARPVVVVVAVALGRQDSYPPGLTEGAHLFLRRLGGSFVPRTQSCAHFAGAVVAVAVTPPAVAVAVAEVGVAEAEAEGAVAAAWGVAWTFDSPALWMLT